MGCDVIGSSDSDLVTVIYSVDGSGTANIAYLDQEGNQENESNAALPWSMEFEAEEGSQVLYLRVDSRSSGSAYGTIRAGGELLSDLSSSGDVIAATSAWGDNEVKFTYLIASGHEGTATFNTVAGLDSLNLADLEKLEGTPTFFTREEMTVPAGFQASVSIYGDGIDSGDSCLFSTLIYEPKPGLSLTLANRQSCSLQAHGIELSATVPGY